MVILIDLMHSRLQYSKTPLDGDLPAIVMPDNSYKTVLEDPIGYQAIFKGKKYAATNRFTAHYITYLYFNNVPIWFQNFLNPIESIYASIVFIKILMHLGFLIMISLYAIVIAKLEINRLWIGMFVLTPFLIVSGNYGTTISFIDPSITYAIFYTLPVIALLIFYFPLFKIFVSSNKKPFSGWVLIPWLIFQFIIVFFGPLTAPTIIIISLFYLLYCSINYLRLKEKSLKLRNVINTFISSNPILFIFTFSGLFFGFYSICLGNFNIENDWCQKTLFERYCDLPKGIIKTFFDFSKGGAWLITLFLINTLLLYYYEGKTKIYYSTLFLILFLLAYSLLVPFGGCRSYRPFILRNDVSLPMITLLLIFITQTTIRIFYLLKGRIFLFYLTFFVFIGIKFIDEDKLPLYTNDQEKKSLYFIKKESERNNLKIIVPYEQPIVSWNKIDSFYKSTLSAEFLYRLKITDKCILYKNK